MTIAGFLTYLLLLIWGPIGVCLFLAIVVGTFIHWASKRFL